MTKLSYELLVYLGTLLAIYLVGGYFMRKLITHAVKSSRHNKWGADDMKKRQVTLLSMFSVIWRTFMSIIVVISLVRYFFPSIDLSPLFASAGIVGVALGLGAQSLIKDFISGLFIISENQYRVGDVVQIDAAQGTVERIGARSTVLRDVDGNVHYLPNGTILHVINKTMGVGVSRFRIAIDPSADIDVAISVINNVGQQLSEEKEWKKLIVEPPTFQSIEELSGSSTTLIIAGKTSASDQWAVSAEMRKRLQVELKNAGIKLAKNTLAPRRA